MRMRFVFFLTAFFNIGIQCLFSNTLYPFDSIVYEIENISFANGAKGSEWVNLLGDLVLKEPGDISKRAQYIYCRSILNNTQGINDTSLISEISFCLEALSKPSYFFEKTLLQYSLSLNYVSKGDYAEAFTHAVQALEEFQNQNNQKFVAKTLMLLGNICIYIKSYNMADDYYDLALEKVTPLQLEYYHIRLNKYTILTYQNKISESIDSLITFIPKAKSYSSPGILATVYLNLGGFYRIVGQRDQAFHYLTLVQEMLDCFDNRRITMTLYQNLGFYYIDLRDFEQAASYFQKSKAIAIENKSPSQLFHASHGLSSLYEQSGNADSAYVYLKQCYALRNQLSNNSKTIEAYQAYVSVLLESSAKELTIAEQKLQLKNRRFSVTIISSLALILLAVLLLIVVQQKKKLKEAENRDLAERLQHDIEIQTLQEEKIESQIREIASFSLMLSNKNNVLQQIADVFKHPANNNEEALESTEEINRIIKSNLNTDSDWNAFMLHFDKVHPQFFHKLKEKCPGLTENNLRMCAYFRIGMSSKQIAQILNIMPNAVRKIRFRLKKKFGLEEDEDFNDFIRNI